VHPTQVLPRILLVEDDSGIRESVADCLASEGYHVDAVENGAVALDRLASGPRPDLLMVDLVMPVMTGAELLDRARDRGALEDVPVVLMTAAMATKAMPLPAVHAVLAKPFELDALLDTVARHCRRGVAA
jgi:CheY-like chemotaxis protein